MVKIAKAIGMGSQWLPNHNHIYTGDAAMNYSNSTKICPKCQEIKSVSEFHKNKSNIDGLQRVCKACQSEYQCTHKKEIREYKQKHYQINKEKIAKYQQGYYQVNKEKILEYNREYDKTHKKEIAERKRRYRQCHKEEIVKNGREYRKTHNKELTQYFKKYYQTHKEEKTKYSRKYNQSHKEEIAECCRKYRLSHKKELKIIRESNKKEIAKYQKEYNKTKNGKNANQKARHKRRALKIGSIVEDFSPIEIFERDGYRCQICNRKTRPDFKNPNHPLYPNLDHLIPLSKGGEHSRKNTQCLCRQCNIEKHNKENFGDQMRLFG